MAVCNRIGETGAVTGLIIPKERAGRDESVDIAVDAGEIVPVVACPPDPTHIRPLKEVAGLLVTQVIVGGCTGGRLDDIKALVQAMRGRKVHPDTVLLVTPASAGVAEAMESDGLTRALRQAGAVINPRAAALARGFIRESLPRATGPSQRASATCRAAWAPPRPRFTWRPLIRPGWQRQRVPWLPIDDLNADLAKNHHAWNAETKGEINQWIFP